MTGTQHYDAHSTELAEQDPWLGSVIGQRYRIEARIGQGGMGLVYRGQHLELGKRVAIKRLDPRIATDPAGFERFRQEAIAASRIESPHVVHVFDWGKSDDGSPYLVMELLEGCDLRELYRREGRLLVDQATRIVGQVLRALVRTHDAQILHRDLKPENVFLCNYGSDELYVKLLDFGISKQLVATASATAVTKRGVILGTASYMSPEQARGEVTLDARSDLYSVGAILYEALTGQVPHRARTYEATLVAICTRDAEDVRLLAPFVSEGVASVVARALKRDPNERFDAARAFLEALTHAVPESGVRISDPGPERSSLVTQSSAHPLSQSPIHPRRNVSFWRLLIAGSALAALALGAATYAVMKPDVTPPNRVVNITSSAPVNAPTSSVDASRSSMIRQVESPPAITSSLGKPEFDGSLGTSTSRAMSHRHTATTTPSTNASTEPPGVASGLKLRRTMP